MARKGPRASHSITGLQGLTSWGGGVSPGPWELGPPRGPREEDGREEDRGGGVVSGGPGPGPGGVGLRDVALGPWTGQGAGTSGH